MNDKGKIIAGLVIFFALLTTPFWFNMGKAAPVPKPELSKNAGKKCIRPTEWMRAEHMQLLNDWRDTVVRDAKRTYINEEGKSFDMSLSNTCLDCHDNKAQFCDRCHDYASARPYCWDCHIDNPKGEK